ncbi:mucin-binding protein [Pediococcus damnosus]|uniref:Cell surface protein n=1 Tax=Pediococcus damnosus TaxID=51663 RepID=A0AAC9FJT2_9LACO|nr:MucBP domain-containing protein [Pediococcus damnosus]AMV63840.1 cell surface protein precursor [Pediococcus damnosus]
MGEKKLHYKMYKDGKKFVFAAIATLSFVVFGGVSTVAVHADTTSGNLTAATVNSTSDTKSAAQSAATVASSASDTKSAAQSAATAVSSASDTKSAAQSAATAASSASDTKSAAQSAATAVSSASDTKSAAQSAATAVSSASDTKSAAQSAATAASSASDTKSAAQSAATAVSSASDTKSAAQSAATAVSSASDTKSAAQSAATAVSSASDTKSAAQSAATAASSASDTNSFVQLMADNATAAYNSTPIDDATSTGFSVSDPDYPSGMWIDPDNSHYSYEWLQAKKGGNQIVFSTNRTGDGIVYVTELSPSNAVLKQYTLNQNTKVPSAVFDSTTYYNDAYFEMVRSYSNSFVTKYRAGGFDNNYYTTLSCPVPKLITQTTYYVDKDGKQITDSNGNPVVAYTQKGLVGQNYTTSDVNVINGYYATAPANSNGVMSPYGEIGASYVKDFHNGIVITYTQTGSDGTMSASIAQNGIVLETWPSIKPSDPTIIYKLYKLYNNDYDIYGIINPYIPQTSDIKYVYNKLGNWIVYNPDGSTTSRIYPNDPSNPTKIADSSVPDYPVIAFIPGYVPEDQMGTPLVPVDPDDRTKGYIPPTPSDNGTDTTITYTADKQKGSVSYVDDTTGKTLKTDSISGTTGSKSSYSTSGNIADYKKHGYELVTDGYPADLTFDNDDTTDQNFTVHLKHQLTPVNPTDPQTPGTPINPDEPNGPKWPISTNYDKTVNETVSYVDQNGHVVAKQHTDSVNFTRTVVVDNVTGEVITSGAGTTAWTATNGDTTFDAVVSPVVPGSVADKAQTAAVTDLNADSADVNETVTYTKVGSLVPSSSDGNFPGAPTVVYPNDPRDATKVTPAGVPTVPGYTAHDPEGNVLTPGSSYQPSDPTKDTTITYTADKQKGSVSYVDDTTGKTLKTDSISGTTGSKSSYSTSGNIADYKKHGYELVTDGYPADLTFDNDDTTDQNFTVHLKHQLTPVNPTDPQTPGTPINPDEPNGPKWPISTNYDKTVNETVSYVDQNGHVVAKQHTDSVNFTRTVVVDNVTGEVITSGAGTTAWTATNGDTTFDAVVSPVVPGSVADKAQTAAVTDLNADSADVNETVTYTKVGSLVPSSSDGNFPGAPTVVYPNDPSDATKVTPAGVPTVPGYTAHDPEGNVLTPGSSYQPSDPTKDTTITYTADKQKGSVSYVDDTTGKTLKTDSISGTTGSKSSYSTSGNIADYKKQGYELVTDGYPADLTFDNDDTTDQNFTVHLKHQLTPVNPTDPQTPGAPINPDEPDGPKWPTSTNYDKTVNETVSYVDQNGHVVAKQHTDSVNFTRTVVVDNVTGEVITSGAGTTAWTATNGDTTFDAVVSPVVPGSVADKAQTAAVTDLNADSADVNETVTYTKVGSLVPSSSDGNFPGAPTVVYPNDPSDATKVTPAGVPTVPGYTAHDPEGNVLTPGSSYQPSDPTKDTTITYTADKQKGSVSYVDDTTGKTLKTDSISGTTGSKSSYSTSGNIADYKKQGYELVTDGYPADLTFDNDDTTDQNFTVHLKHQLTPVNPTDPQTPGTPINPDEPNGPKWPTSTNYDKTVNETVSYVDQNGHVVAKQHTDSVNFTRTVVVDNVTGEVITSGAGTTAWTATNGDTTFDAVVSPVVPGSVADKAQTAAVTDLNADSADVNETVTYTKVGSLVPSSSDGNFPGAPTVVYPNDPSDATKVTPAGVPTVPGYTAHDPEGNVLTPGSSYQPSDPTKDTTITYTADKQKGSVSYVDDTTGKTLKTDSISGTTGSKSSYSTSGNIADYKKHGYELVTDGYPADLTFDNDDTTDQNFTVHLKHQLTPVNPTDPQTPGAPINPDEPDGPKWPTSTNYDKTVNETVSYVDQNGHVVAKQHTDSVNFTRTVVVDNVTGEVITSGAGTTAWTATNGDTTFDAVVSPVVPGSVADKAQTAAVTDLNADSADVNETVTYTKVGSLVPSSSDGNFPGAPTVVYPNDPSDATKVTPAGVPTVPGYTAHDPEGNVLTPGSSYQPSDPTKDTTITYTADKQKGSVSYVDDTTGKTLKTDSISGTTGSKSSYSTSGNIADYKKQGYELVTDGYPADLTFDNDDTTDQNFTVHLKHQNIQSTEAKTVTETIHYQGAGNQTPADNTAQVTFTRQVSTDTVTGEKTYGSWSADQSFAAVTSPVIKGYTPDQAEIGAQTVSGDASDLDFTVIYTKDAPTKPVNPSQPTMPAKPVNPSQPTTPAKPVQAGQAAATNFVDQRLPQTDETDQQHMTLSGLLLLAMSSVLGLFGMTKRQRKE